MVKEFDRKIILEDGQEYYGYGFKNFDERSYNYEDMVWEGMRKRQRGGTGDGTQ